MGETDGKTDIICRKEALRSDRIWMEDHRIRSYETDPHGSLSIPSICNYLQEAAANHAHALGISIRQMIPQNYTWVLSRLALRMDSYFGWGDPIRVCTWPSGIQGPFALRDFLIAGRDDRRIGAAVSAWLLIDAKTRLPLRRVQSVFDRLQPADLEHPLDNTLSKLPQPEGHDQEELFSVRYSDLDANRHVNNVGYISWIVGSLPPAMLDTAILTGLEINYLAEAFAGDQIIAGYKKTEETPLSFLHFILRKSDGRELCRTKTAWTRREQRPPSRLEMP